MKRALRLSLLLIAASTLAAATAYHFRPRPAPPPPVLEAAPAADAAERLFALTLPDLDGRPRPLAQWRGRVLVVNFWATWCTPCKEEMPEFSRISEENAGKGVQFVGISIDTPEKVRAFLEQVPVSYPLLVGSVDHLRLAADLGNPAQALPFTAVLDRQGRIARVKLGRFAAADLSRAIESALRAR